jgi:NADPH2:quinone reductase
MMVTFGQTSAAIYPVAPVLLSQEDSLFLTRLVLFHYIERRDAPESLRERALEVVASGKVRSDVNQRFVLMKAAEARKTFEACATSAATILII